MVTRNQKLNALKDFLETQAFAQVNGHDANDGVGCEGHEAAFTAKAEELLSLIEAENYGYEPRLVNAFHKPHGPWSDKRDQKSFLDRLTSDQYKAFRNLQAGETFTLLTYDNGTTSFEVLPDGVSRIRAAEIQNYLQQGK